MLNHTNHRKGEKRQPGRAPKRVAVDRVVHRKKGKAQVWVSDYDPDHWTVPKSL